MHTIQPNEIASLRLPNWKPMQLNHYNRKNMLIESVNTSGGYTEQANQIATSFSFKLL
jgi:hypothetical protein